ncbi:MAG: hypothetical protein QOI71_3967, partial [Gaiellales bacterium]|nr:hypothetical protein [Gaiellales bacterium]
MPAVATATSFYSEDWETVVDGGLDGWTLQTNDATPTTGDGNLWHIESNSTSSVSSDINPPLVTLPDSGAIPAANSGVNDAWFGDASSGTFCFGYQNVTQSPKNGCTSSGAVEGELVSPTIDLTNAPAETGAALRFASLFEVEGVAADGYDTMSVDYSIDDG